MTRVWFLLKSGISLFYYFQTGFGATTDLWPISTRVTHPWHGILLLSSPVSSLPLLHKTELPMPSWLHILLTCVFALRNASFNYSVCPFVHPWFNVYMCVYIYIYIYIFLPCQWSSFLCAPVSHYLHCCNIAFWVRAWMQRMSCRAIRASHILVSSCGQACLSGLRYACQIIEHGRWQCSVHSFPRSTAPNLNWLSPEVLEQVSITVHYISTLDRNTILSLLY